MSERPITATEQDILNRLPQAPLQHGRMVVIPPETRAALFTCTWEADEDGIWHAACDRASQHLYCFNEDGPDANGFTFCPFCGKPLVEAKPMPEFTEDLW